MKRMIMCLLLAAVLCVCATACGNEAAPSGGNANNSSAQTNSGKNENKETAEKKYQWDIKGDMKMHWETTDDYLQYIDIDDEACPLGTIDEKPFVSMKAIFGSWEGWPTSSKFSGTNILPWHFDCEAELGEEAEANDEYLIVWGGMSYRADSKASPDEVVKDSLSYYLVGDRTRDAKEGTLVTTGLRTKEINGHKIMYVRMQFEYEHTLSDNKVITMCVQRTNAITPIETPEGTVYLDVMIDEFRTDTGSLSDDSIIDKIFENVVYEK